MKQSTPWTLNNPHTISKQILLLSLANLKTRYRKTIAGFLWVMFNPIITFGVFSLIFKQVLKIDVDQYYLFLLTGLIPWIFFSQTLDMTVSMYVQNSQLLKAFPVHPLVYLGAQAIDNFLNFLGAFILLLIPISINSGITLIGGLLFPIPLFLLMLFTISFSHFLATLNVFYRDIRYLTSFGVSIFFFLTPIFYSVELIDDRYEWMMNINPLYHIFRPLRIALYKFDLEDFSFACLYSFGVTSFFLFLAVWTWRKKGPEVFHHV